MPSHVDRPPAEKFDELVIKVFKGLKKPKKKANKNKNAGAGAAAILQRQMQLKNFSD